MTKGSRRKQSIKTTFVSRKQLKQAESALEKLKAVRILKSLNSENKQTLKKAAEILSSFRTPTQNAGRKRKTNRNKNRSNKTKKNKK